MLCMSVPITVPYYTVYRYSYTNADADAGELMSGMDFL